MQQEPLVSSRQDQIEANARHCAERGIQIPSFAQMRNPERVPEAVQSALKEIGLWDLHPLNLFRITWKNQPQARGGGYGAVNALELPSALTGTKARIIGLCGKWFPTGAHKVGATFGCLVPSLISGTFDPINAKAAWPSTGNYCRGGAYVSRLLGCESIAILPEGMSRERFEWLEKVANEIIKTHGCESNVKEIFDMCWELERTRPEVHIFNQFAELGNTRWHQNVTGPAIAEVFRAQGPKARLAGCVFSSGSGGTLAAGYHLKNIWPEMRLAAAEALQCPTLLNNGYGDHRIEGIGDKHVPWIHDLKRTDMAIAVDDELPMRLMRLFNENKGQNLLRAKGLDPALLERLNWIGISGIANVLAAVKMAKYYELGEDDIIVTMFTDSMEMYGSRLEEAAAQKGRYSELQAHLDWEVLQHVGIDYVQELSYYDKKRIHNLKYYTWVEQQHKDPAELNAQWYDHQAYWGGLEGSDGLDAEIEAFNQRVRFYMR